MIDDRTPNLNLPLPHAENLLIDDVGRLREALSGLDAWFGTQRSEVQAALSQTRSEVETALADAIAAEVSARQQIEQQLQTVAALVYAAL